jgi:hypothetical protein
MASPPRSALDDELPYELGKSSGGSDVPESLRAGPRVERWTCSPYCHTRRAYDQPPAQTGDCPFLELTPVTDTPSDASTMPSTPWHGYGSRFKAMPTFFYFIAFCYIIDSPKQHFQPAYGMYASISFRRGPPLAISVACITAARAFSNLTDDTNYCPTSVLWCRSYGWVTPFPPTH